MNNFSSKTLAQIVTENHRAATIFEKYNLDFCCKGKRTLERACKEQDIFLDTILTELETVASECDYSYPFENLTATQLTDHIVGMHHNYTRKNLPQLCAYAEKVSSKHGDRNPELFKIYEKVRALREDMDAHMQKEEIMLFPTIKELENESNSQNCGLGSNSSILTGAIGMMQHEHDQAGSILKEIKQLSGNYIAPQNACTTYKLLFSSLEAFEKDLHQHVHLENNILFPKALTMLQRRLQRQQ